MRLSARPGSRGKWSGHEKGQKTGHVRINIGDGVVIIASITNEAIGKLEEPAA